MSVIVPPEVADRRSCSVIRVAEGPLQQGPIAIVVGVGHVGAWSKITISVVRALLNLRRLEKDSLEIWRFVTISICCEEWWIMPLSWW